MADDFAAQLEDAFAPAAAEAPTGPRPSQIALPTDPILDHAENTLTKVSNTQFLWDSAGVLPPQLDPFQRPQSGNESPRLQWTGPDDRTLLQKYVLGTVRQVAASAMDMSFGLGAVGAQWVSAGVAGAAKLLNPEDPEGTLKVAQQINTFAGSI